jgi:uncharacterized protein YneF (UPF0154 family)
MRYERTKEELALQDVIQDQSRQKEVRISGLVSMETENILSYTQNVLEEMSLTSEAQQNRIAIYDLAEKLGISEDRITEVYQDGLRYNIKASIRLDLFNTGAGMKETLEKIIGGFTLNLRRTLKFFLKEMNQGATIIPDFVTEILKRGYILSPEYIIDIKSEYQDNQDMGNSMVDRLLRTSTNPRLRISQKLSKISELRQKYLLEPVIDDTTIRSAVILQRKPEEVLEKWLAKIKELIAKYKDNPDIDESMIRTAVVGNKDPEEWIRNYFKKVSQLTSRFADNPDINMSTVKRLAGRNKNPTEAADRLIKELDSLSLKFKDASDIDRAFIKNVLLCFTDAEEALSRKISQIKELQEKYRDDPDVENWMIKHVVNCYDDPAMELERILLKFYELRDKYASQVNVSDIKYVAVTITEPDEYLQGLIRNK